MHCFVHISNSKLERYCHLCISSDFTHVITSKDVFVISCNTSISTHIPTVTSSKSCEHNRVLENVKRVIGPIPSLSRITIYPGSISFQTSCTGTGYTISYLFCSTFNFSISSVIWDFIRSFIVKFNSVRNIQFITIKAV